MAIASHIMYEGPNDVFVWKHPTEGFNIFSQLTVHESQEAILFRNGQALDLFGPGRHTLKSENLPVLGKIVNIPFKGVTPFHCEVYFINKVHSMNVRWGTRNPIPIKDPVYNVILPVGANGQFSVQIDDSRKFLTKLVGTLKVFTQETLINYFRGILMSRIKDYISTQFIEAQISFLESHAHLTEMSNAIYEELLDDFDQYGIKLVNFNINTIFIPENDPSYMRLRDALAKKAEMDLVGYNYSQERTFSVLDKAAGNAGSAASVMGAGIGLGMGANIGGTIGNAMGNTMGNINMNTQEQRNRTVCPKCGTVLPDNAVFCSNCSHKIESPAKGIPHLPCPKCGKSVPDGKFCIICGSPLHIACKKCGASLPGHAAFCVNCGEKLE